MIFQGVIGNIDPLAINKDFLTVEGGGLITFLSSLTSLLVIISGLFSLVNFIFAGYLYLGSNGNPQQLQAAGNKIVQSLIGLVIVAGAFIIAGLIGFLFFKDATFLFNPIFRKIF